MHRVPADKYSLIRLAHALAKYRVLNAQPSNTQGHRILIACAPKTGSTYLTTLFALLPKFSRVILNTVGGRQEEELRQERLLAFHHLNYVAKNHIMCSAHRAALIERYGLKTIVITRSLADSIVSYRDHLADTSSPLQVIEAPSGFQDMPKTEQYNCLIDLAAPWYINFVASWLNFAPTLNSVFVHYESLIQDPAGTIRDATDKLGITMTLASIEEAVETASLRDTRKNVGIAGRGTTELTTDQRARLTEMLSYHGERLLPYLGDDLGVNEIPQKSS